MKKLFALLIVFIGVNSVNAQSLYHFGLKLGDIVSEDMIVSRMSKYGTLCEIGQTEEDGIYTTYYFQDVVVGENKYDIVSLQTLKDGKLFYVGYTFTDNSRADSRTLDDIYKSISDTIAVKYNMLDLSDSTTQYSLFSMGTVPTVTLQRLIEDGNDVSVELAYISAKDIVYEVFQNIDFGYPEIQDKFFGMKFGDIVSAYGIKNAMASKATFLEQQREGDGTLYVFKDAVFAGNLWDYGNIGVTSNSEFYYCSFYDSWPDGYSYEDERKDAMRSFENLKSRLDEKYGEVELESDDTRLFARYFGCNDVVLILSNKRAQSSGGAYRRYVELTYIHKGIIERQREVSNDEL